MNNIAKYPYTISLRIPKERPKHLIKTDDSDEDKYVFIKCGFKTKKDSREYVIRETNYLHDYYVDYIKTRNKKARQQKKDVWYAKAVEFAKQNNFEQISPNNRYFWVQKNYNPNTKEVA